MVSEPYYSMPIGRESYDIRLLSVDIWANGQLDCNLKVFQLYEDPQRVLPNHLNRPLYSAISYTWGDENPTYSILLNGYPMRVRSNLYKILHFLAKREGRFYLSSSQEQDNEYDKCSIFTDHTKWLPLPSKYQHNPDVPEEDKGRAWFWIDALCFDQENLEEKAEFVPFMAQIYSHAEHVMAFVGYDNPPSPAWDYVLRLATLNPPSNRSIYPSLINADEPPNWDLEEVLSRPYWLRMWIVQEVLNAKQLAFVDGTSVYSGKFLNFAMAATEGLQHTPGFEVLSRRRDYTGDARTEIAFGPLAIQMLLLQNHQCQRFHDRAYAMLGCTYYAKNFPEADYTQSPEDLLADVLVGGQWIISEMGSSWYFIIEIERLGGEPTTKFKADLRRHADGFQVTFDNSGDFLQMCHQLCLVLGARPSTSYKAQQAIRSCIYAARTHWFEGSRSRRTAINSFTPREPSQAEINSYAHGGYAIYQPTGHVGNEWLSNRIALMGTSAYPRERFVGAGATLHEQISRNTHSIREDWSAPQSQVISSPARWQPPMKAKRTSWLGKMKDRMRN